MAPANQLLILSLSIALVCLRQTTAQNIASGDSANCVITGNATQAVCWGTYNLVLSHPAGFAQVAAHLWGVCALTNTGLGQRVFVVHFFPPLFFVFVSRCSLFSYSVFFYSVVCNPTLTAVPTGGPFNQIMITENRGCFLQTSGTAVCSVCAFFSALAFLSFFFCCFFVYFHFCSFRFVVCYHTPCKIQTQVVWNGEVDVGQSAVPGGYTFTAIAGGNFMTCGISALDSTLGM